MINPSNVSTIYVSQKDGIDGDTGFYPRKCALGGPLKSIKRAIELVCWLRNAGYFQPITIKIADEEYILDEALEICDKPGNYGGEISDIAIEPYTKTRILGARPLTGFREDKLNGVRCFSADVPEIKDGAWYTDFYVDNERAKYTRFPSNGTLDPISVENNATAINAHSSWFIAKKEDFEKISKFENINDCVVSFNHYWIDEHTTVAGIDETAQRVEFSVPSTYSLSSDYEASAMHYYIENVKEAFKNPGEWYLDRNEAKLYYVPKEGQTPENIRAYLPIFDEMIKISGTLEKPVKGICLRKLELAYNRGDAEWKENDGEKYASPLQSTYTGSGLITMKYAQHCAIEDCTIHGTGIHAVRLDKGCRNVRIEDNDIYDIGAGGVVVAGGDASSPETERSCNNVIHNNRIEHLGRRYAAACGVLLCHASSNRVSHNEIADLYYTGISVGWIWGYADSVSDNNVIEYNHIHNVGQGALSDMGGIYLLGKQKGAIIRGNVIHDVEAVHYGGWGIYTDEGSSYIRIEKNLCYNLSHNCFHQHWGEANILVNNVFARSKEHPIKFGHSEMHTGAIFERNIIVSGGMPIYNFTEWMDGGSKNNCAHAYVAGGHGNILFDEKAEGVTVLSVDGESYELGEAQGLFGLEDGSVTANPKFADIDACDFEILNKELLEKMGIEPIDIKKAGKIQ